jgi:Flp pilus assembly protein TadD
MEDHSQLDEFLELVESTPEDELAHYGLAQEYVKAGRYEEAVASFQRVIKLKPDYMAGYRELGKALMKIGRVDEARASLRKGRALAEEHGDGQAVREIDVYLKRMGKNRL